MEIHCHEKRRCTSAFFLNLFGRGSFIHHINLQDAMQRLQTELEEMQAMMAAKEEKETLLKAEMMRLTEETSRLREEVLEQRGTAMALQEQLAEAVGTTEAVAVCGCVSMLLSLLLHSGLAIQLCRW